MRIEAEAQDGSVIDARAGARTLDDYVASWLSTRLVKGRPLTPATKVGYQRLYRRNIAPRLGARQLRTLRPETVRTWHADVTAAAGPDQAAKSYRLLRAVLATAESDELIRQNPCRIRGGGQENTAERPMVATSLVLELADAIAPPYRAMVLLAGFAGLRTGESLGLRRGDVDLLHAEVRITQQAQEVAGSGRVVLAPKSEAGRRTVAVPVSSSTPSSVTWRRSRTSTPRPRCSPAPRAVRFGGRRSPGHGERRCQRPAHQPVSGRTI